MSRALIGKVALASGVARIGAVNVKGLFVATQEAMRHMGEGGRIIHIGSSNSDHVPYGGGSLDVETLAAN
jgi:3-oxoacyl-[acyl-carrier protein] reductase